MKNKQILDLYSDYLLASFKLTTATGLSELIGRILSHDQISRFLGQGLFTSRDYWRMIKPLIRKVEHPMAIVKIDDTILEKPHSTENTIICYHWDHSNNRHVKGINILNFLYEAPLANGESISIPACYEIIAKTEKFTDPKSGKEKKRSPVKKNELVRRRLKVLHQCNKVQFQYVTWDTWFSSTENFDFVHYTLKKYFISAIKSNRLVALSEQDQLAGKFIRVYELPIQKDQAITVRIKGMDFSVLLVKQVFANKDGSTGELYVVTNDLLLDAQLIATAYDSRWGVEVFHKSLKQNVGLGKSPTKNEITQSNHIFAAMIGWTKLEMLSLMTQTNHFALKNQIYVKALNSAWQQVQELKTQHLKLLPAA